MAETADEHSTAPRQNSPISPIGATNLVLSSSPNRSIHDVIQDLVEWARRNKCRLWCNGNVVAPHFIATSLQMVVVTEADGRPRVDVVPAGAVGWVQQVYKFEFDADELRTLLPPAARAVKPNTTPMPPAPKEWNLTKRWVYDQMYKDRFPVADHDYVATLHKHCCLEHRKIEQKTIANYVSEIRKELREASASE
jgi:hypothetical protein